VTELLHSVAELPAFSHFQSLAKNQRISVGKLNAKNASIRLGISQSQRLCANTEKLGLSASFSTQISFAKISIYVWHTGFAGHTYVHMYLACISAKIMYL